MMRFIDQIPSSRRLQAVSAVGVQFPVHATANGKAMLAALPTPRVEQILPDVLVPCTPNTIVDRETLMEELDCIRAAGGIAFDCEEESMGIVAVGAVVRNISGPVAAVSVPFPVERKQEVQELVTVAIRTTC